MAESGNRDRTNPFDKLAVFCQLDHAVGGYPCAVRNVEALQSGAVLGNGVYGGLGDLFVSRDVQGGEVAAVLDESYQAGVGQALAVGKC